MNINVLYFASFADKANKAQEQLTIENDMSLAQLYEQIKSSYGFDLEMPQVRVAINDEFADWGATINEGDTVVFIPPVAGG